MEKIAIYDLDRTLLKHATYTPFLLFAASRRSAWRLIFAPLWIAAMIAYKAGVCSRGTLKQLGLDLFLGRRVRDADLSRLAERFAARVVPRWLGPGARDALDRDRNEGRRLVLATAAFDFYARDIADMLGFDAVVATRHAIEPREPGRCRIVGENCYGAHKVPRVAELLRERALERESCHIRFYTDSASDAPLLDWCDEGVLVDVSAGRASLANARGWKTARFS